MKPAIALALLCGSLWGQATLTPCVGGEHPVTPCMPILCSNADCGWLAGPMPKTSVLVCTDNKPCPPISQPSTSTEPRKETMDPLTSAMNAFAAFNQFLCTPAGQKLAIDQEAIFATLMGHFGVHLAPSAAQVAAAGTVKAQ